MNDINDKVIPNNIQNVSSLGHKDNLVPGRATGCSTGTDKQSILNIDCNKSSNSSSLGHKDYLVPGCSTGDSSGTDKRSVNQTNYNQKRNVSIVSDDNPQKRLRFSRLQNSNCTNTLSRYGYIKTRRRNILRRIRYTILKKIETDILSFRMYDKSSVEKYDPVPLIIVSQQLIKEYISFDNVIILQNPQIEKTNMQEVFYDASPKFVGKNLLKKRIFFEQYGVGIDVGKIPKKHIAIIVPELEFQTLIPTLKKKFLFIKVPDHKPNPQYDEEFEKTYILLMYATNKAITKETNDVHIWNKEFSDTITKHLKVNLRGSRRNSKHHRCIGKYFGFGIISKYNVSENLSVGYFAGNTKECDSVKEVIGILKQDLCHSIEQFKGSIPMLLYCGFSLTSALIQIIQLNKKHCWKLSQMIENNGISVDGISISNWICKDAQTLDFHQEYDSSYTFISVPYWEKKNKEDNTEQRKGTANFIFKWTTNDEDNYLHRYLPLKMTDGITIFFSGYGCYHRQHRTNNGTFWNFASYQNRTFFQKLRKSIIRCCFVENCTS